MADGLDARSLHTRTTAAGRGKEERRKGGREERKGRKEGRGGVARMGAAVGLNGSVGALAKCHKLSLPDLTQSI